MNGSKEEEVIACGHADEEILYPASADNSLDLPPQNSRHMAAFSSTSPIESHSSRVSETVPSLVTMDAVDEERVYKLTRINNLLAEAAQLQFEVFY